MSSDERIPAGTSEEAYSGVDNLDAMEQAVNYRRFLVGLIESAGTAAVGRRVLDFGSGTGTYASDARGRGFDVTCVELDPGLQARLRAQGFSTLSSPGDVEGSFGLVYSFNVLEHIDDDVGALASLLEATAVGGTLLLYVPAFPVLYSSMDRKVGHLRRYRRRDLVDKTTRAGFVVDSCRYADSLGFPASLAYRFLGDRSGGIGGITLYDRYLFPVSRLLDRLVGRFFGKNLVLRAHRPLST